MTFTEQQVQRAIDAYWENAGGDEPIGSAIRAALAAAFNEPGDIVKKPVLKDELYAERAYADWTRRYGLRATNSRQCFVAGWNALAETLGD